MLLGVSYATIWSVKGLLFSVLGALLILLIMGRSSKRSA